MIDSLYMTVITISTVGFGEVRQLSSFGRMFTIGLILGGGGVVAYSFSATAEFFMSGEWRKFLESRRCYDEICKSKLNARQKIHLMCDIHQLATFDL